VSPRRERNLDRETWPFVRETDPAEARIERVQSIWPKAMAGKLLLDHVSSHGPTVSHIRGIVLLKSVENLRHSGLFERYAAELDPAYRAQIELALAASWLPLELAEAHYAACDRMRLSDAEIERLGSLMAERMSSALFSILLKMTRQAGMESMWSALKQNDRIWDRMYRGGQVTIIQTGPKDLIMENRGIPLAQSRHWRFGLRAYWLALGKLMTNVVYVKQIPPREPHAHSVAFAGSWV
jgi:hypothetical protein